MTLRTRGKMANTDGHSPMTSRQGTRGTPRGEVGTPPRDTPTGRILIKADSPTNSVETTHATEPLQPNVEVPSSSSSPNTEHDEVFSAIRGVEEIRLNAFARSDDASHAEIAEALLSLARIERDSNSLPNPSNTLAEMPDDLSGSLIQQHTHQYPKPIPTPKIIIRMPQSVPMPTVTHRPASLPHPSEGSMYPSLPGVDLSRYISEEEVDRANSLSTTLTEVAIDGDDASGLSDMSVIERTAREESAGTSGSEGPAMPGKFGR